jgi:signal transduction histidine kinase
VNVAIAQSVTFLAAGAAVALAAVCLRLVRQRRRLAAALVASERRLAAGAGELRRLSGELAGELLGRERALERLRLADLALERSSVGVTISDADGRIVYVNPADAAMHGYTVEELLGQPARVYGLPGGGAAPPPAPHCWRREGVNRARDGRVFPVRLVSDTVLGDDGRVAATVTLCEDLSERRQVEQLKQEFISTVSHELRTPLTSIVGAVGLLRGGGLASRPERAQELLAVAERNGDRLLRLINDLLDLQRLERGELRFERAPVILGAVLEEAVKGIRPFAELHGVHVRTVTSAALVRLVTDPHRLAQVLYNLLSNAIKFSAAGDEVLLAARELGAEVELVVRDRGPGVPAEFKQHLFEKFAQADGGPARRRGGSGLGLSISKRLVEGLGGTIALDSAAGAGTTVTVRLPRQEAAASAS